MTERTRNDILQIALRKEWRSLLRAARASEFINQVGATYATQLTNIVFGFAITVVIANHLGPEAWGLYAVALTIGSLGVQFSNLGMHSSNTYYAAQKRELVPVLLANTLLTSFGVGGLVVVLGYALFFLWPNLAPLQGSLLYLSVLWIPFGLSFLLIRNLLLGIREIGAYNVAELTHKSLSFFLICLVFSIGLRTVEIAFSASFVALLISMGWTLRTSALVAKGWQRPSLALIGLTMGVGFKAYLSCLLSFLVLRIDLLMVKYMLGAEHAGYYSVAANMADVCMVLAAVVGAVLFPRLAATNDVTTRITLTRKMMVGTGLALLPGLVLISTLAVPLVEFVFGRPFLPAATAFVWLVPGIFMLSLEIVGVQFLNSLGFPKSVIVIWLVTTVLNIVANLWAIPSWGIVGASAVSSFSYTLAFFLVLCTMHRHSGAARK